MTTVNVQDAKTRLSELLKRAEAGEHIIIARGGKPVAELRPVDKPRPRWGTLAGLGAVPESFSDPLPDGEIAAWESSATADPVDA